MFDGADADERAGEDAERVERDNYRVHVMPAPCGADRVDEQGECGQDDEAQPFEDVVDAAGMSQSGTSWVTSAVSGQSLTSTPGSVSPVSVVFLLSVMFAPINKG